jgi:hypothetical protein
MTTTAKGTLEVHIGHEVAVYTVRPDLSVQVHRTYCMVPMLNLTPEERSNIEAKLTAQGLRIRVVEGPNGTVGFMGVDQ